MPDPADTSESVERPSVKPDEDGGSPAPSDGSTGGQSVGDPMADAGSQPDATPSRAGRPTSGPPTDPGTTTTG